jgi:hypothetical protein
MNHSIVRGLRARRMLVAACLLALSSTGSVARVLDSLDSMQMQLQTTQITRQLFVITTALANKEPGAESPADRACLLEIQVQYERLYADLVSLQGLVSLAARMNDPADESQIIHDQKTQLQYISATRDRARSAADAQAKACPNNQFINIRLPNITSGLMTAYDAIAGKLMEKLK